MSKVTKSIYNMRLLDDFAVGNSIIHKQNPAAKLIAAIVFLIVAISFNKYEITSILPMFFYPVIILYLSEIRLMPFLKRVLIVIPLIILIAILNPILDNEKIVFLGAVISRGWLASVSLIIKSILTVSVTLLLIATTRIEDLANAMGKMKVPKIFILIILLTYRYIFVLFNMAEKTSTAYSLRAPKQKGIHPKAWGSFLGHLFLRTFDRAQKVHQAMYLRGFDGGYNMGKNIKIKVNDILFLLFVTAFFVIIRLYDIPQILGGLAIGVIK